MIAVATLPQIYSPAPPVDCAVAQLVAPFVAQFVGWTEAPNLVVQGESERHLTTMLSLLAKGTVTGAGMHDARVAAICIHHGVRELWSADRDFSRFPLKSTGLRVVNHLV